MANKLYTITATYSGIPGTGQVSVVVGGAGSGGDFTIPKSVLSHSKRTPATPASISESAGR